jgi:predicted DNA-binding protein YlxM (UPF0122 family)
LKYATKVIELMAAFPKRDFRMAEIVRYVNPGPKNRKSVYQAVKRVIDKLMEVGRVDGGNGRYHWK